MTVRVRFAPSPTGYLHAGVARTALFNRLFADREGGSLVLRIDDTDVERSRPEYEDAIKEDLRWLGIDWDEGPDKDGGAGPYRQSERLSLYENYTRELLEKDLAYRCFCTPERLDEMRKAQLAKGQPPRYDRRCARGADKPENTPHVVRFRVPDRKVAFKDLVFGARESTPGDLTDFVIADSGGRATYNFATVVDDSTMGITHVIRGSDHLPNTPGQILLFRALGAGVPEFAHLPLVLGPDNAPLSKRHPGSGIRALREEGVLPEAVLNALARLGWSPGEDRLMGLKELSRGFRLEKVSRSPSIFDTSRLGAWNREAISQKAPAELILLLPEDARGSAKEEYLERVVRVVRGNASTTRELAALVRPFTGEARLSPVDKSILKESHAPEVLAALKEAVEKADELDEKTSANIINTVKSATGAKGKSLFMPIRVALTGTTEGIDVASVMALLGREKVIKRIISALEGRGQ